MGVISAAQQWLQLLLRQLLLLFLIQWQWVLQQMTC